MSATLHRDPRPALAALATCPKSSRFAASAAWACLAALLLGMAPAWGQQDREHAQLRQLQQQLQRLQQENGNLQKSLDESQAKTKADADKLKKESQEEVVRARMDARSKAQQIDALTAQLNETTAKLAAANAELERLNKSLGERDVALQFDAQSRKRDEEARALLATRLKLQTERGDLCETQHAGLTAFTSRVLDRYEAEHLRLCEPFTGLWKVKAQQDFQAMREELYGYRIDAAPEAAHKQ